MYIIAMSSYISYEDHQIVPLPMTDSDRDSKTTVPADVQSICNSWLGVKSVKLYPLRDVCYE